jgi:alpha-tubulin suppressor-like RCC1 family protein
MRYQLLTARARALSCVLACAGALLALAAPAPAWASSIGPVAWGLNIYGQLGNGYQVNGGYGPESCRDERVPYSCSRVPVEIAGPREGQVTAFAGGFWHSLALLKNGTVVAWGDNTWGQLGTGKGGGNVPAEVKGLKEVTAVAAGWFHSLAVLKGGTVMAWGENSRGQLGDGNEADSNAPVEVKGLKEATAVAGGERHSLALLKGGTVMAWGANEHGELGDGNETRSDVPVEVKGLKEVTAIAAGEQDSAALLKDGKVMEWGIFHGNVPLEVEGVAEVAAIAGLDPGLALLKDGTVKAFGVASSEVKGLKEVSAIAGSGGHSLALRKDGKVMAWGDNQAGQLGDGTETERTEPVEVRGLQEVTLIGAGRTHSFAIGRQLFGPPPHITALSPGTGLARGGTLVTISGWGFAGSPHVMFGSREATIKSNSETSMVVQSPPGSGKVYVTVTSPTGTTPASGRAAKPAKFKYKRR